MNKEEYISLPLLNRPGFFHFFGTKALTEERAKDAVRGKAVRLIQVHGDAVVKICPAETEERPAEHVAQRGDALMTDCEGVLITMFTSDCLPVIIIDPNQMAVAIVHAGWRGSLLRIVAKTVAALIKEYGADPSALLVGMGPRIGPCCFEVGREVWQEIENEPTYSAGIIVRQQGEKAWINLSRLNRIQLLGAGVRHDNIADADICTHCHPHLFNSYRRDHIKGQNMVSGVLLRKP